MGNHDDRTEILGQKVLQPGDGVNVQVVGRLVHEDDIRIAEQRLRQQDFHLFVTGQVRHLLIEQTFRQTQTLDQLRGVCLCLPAVQFGKLRLQLRCQDAVLFGEVLLGVESVFLLHDVIQPLVAHDNGIQDSVCVVGEVILLEDAHAEIFGDGHLAGGGLELTAENFQKRGFSGTVCADDAVTVAGVELKVYILKQRVAAELQTDIGNSNHIVLVPFYHMRRVAADLSPQFNVQKGQCYGGSSRLLPLRGIFVVRNLIASHCQSCDTSPFYKRVGNKLFFFCFFFSFQ